jgi:hypothetical protein
MRAFDPIVLPARLVVPDRQAKISDSRCIRFQLVRDKNTRSTVGFLQ